MMWSKFAWLLIGVIISALIFGGYTVWRAVDVKEPANRAGESMVSIDRTIEESEKAREMLTQETTEKVVIIRETVKREVSSYGPDMLIDFARNEIDIFRGGSAGSSLDQGASGLDSE